MLGGASALVIEPPIRGVFPAIVTPFTDDGRDVNTKALLRLCDFLIEKGVDGLFVSGTTGESPLLTDDERLTVMRELLAHVRGRTRVVFHTGHIITDRAVELTRAAKELGADGASLATPYYFRFSDAALAEHYARVLEAVDGWPVYLYNIPQTTGNPIGAELVARLKARFPHVAGIKDSSGDMAQIQAYVELVPSPFDVVCGADHLAATALYSGARGIVSSIAGVFPEPYVALHRAVLTGDDDGALRAQKVINRLVRALTTEAHIPMLKAALEARGIPGMGVRRPFLPCSPAGQKIVTQIVREESHLP